MVGIFLTACDQSSQNIDYDVGENLSVSGPSTLVVPNYDSAGTADYIVGAYTIEKEYSWSVEGANASVSTPPRGGESGEGELGRVSTSDTAGTYTVTVETTIDGETATGSASGEPTYPDATTQLSRYNNLGTFASVASATGLTGAVGVRGRTALIPTDGAFLGALDANDDGEIGDAEMPAPGVLAQILKYHVIPGGALRSGDISDGQTVTTALGAGAELTFGTSGGVTVQGDASSAAKTGPDIASDGATLHKIDGVLLPSTVVSINDQTVIRDTDAGVDSVDVEGTYLSDGGFMVLHEASSGDIIGRSEYLEPGFYGNVNPIGIELDNQLSDTTDVVAMPHRDTNGSETFDFPAADGPYTRDGSAVTDTATVATP
jgi:uncharacterized surface protein with fasciclin (FAS1) repeats